MVFSERHSIYGKMVQLSTLHIWINSHIFQNNTILYHSNVFLSSIGHVWLEFRRDEMFYTEHDFQVDLENFEFNLKFHAERIQDKCR